MCISLNLTYLKFVELLEHVDLYFSSNLGSLGPLFLQMFSLPFFFWDSLNLLFLLKVSSTLYPPNSLDSLHFFPVLQTIISVVLSSRLLILSLFAQICCWTTLLKFSFYLFLFFSRTSVWFFFIMSVFLLIFLLCACISPWFPFLLCPYFPLQIWAYLRE